MQEIMDFGASISATERVQLDAGRNAMAPYQLSLLAFDAAADVGDRMGELIHDTADLVQLEDAERSLRDARERIELRLTEIAVRRVELTPPPPLLAAMEAAA